MGQGKPRPQRNQSSLAFTTLSINNSKPSTAFANLRSKSYTNLPRANQKPNLGMTQTSTFQVGFRGNGGVVGNFNDRDTDTGMNSTSIMNKSFFKSTYEMSTHVHNLHTGVTRARNESCDSCQEGEKVHYWPESKWPGEYHRRTRVRILP